MGLDMYLRASKYVSGWGDETGADSKMFNDVLKAVDIPRDMVSKDAPSLTVKFNVAYWRKANAIHKWFVDKCQNGVDDCQESYVSRENLRELKQLCEQTLENKKHADSKLPTQSGFFFGNTDYDEYYFRDIQYTVNILSRLLGDEFKGFEFYYHSSW